MATTARTRSRRRWADALAVAVIGIGIVGAGLAPALTASAGATATVHGVVHADGATVPGLRVGFWSPTDGLVATGQTGSDGAFTLDLPSTTDGYVFAGTDPDDTTVVSTADGKQYVRGVIGAAATKPYASPLYQGWADATAPHLDGGGDVDLRIERAGHVSGVLRSPASTTRLELQRRDGSLVQTLGVARGGRFTSMALAPGTYRVVAVPASPDVPRTVQVAVRSGATATAVLPAAARGARLRGTLTADGDVPAEPVPVLLLRAGVLVARTVTDSTGAYGFDGLDSGAYQLDFGRATLPAAGAAAAAATAAPTTSASATPTPSATAAPGTGPTDSGSTADAVLPGTATVTVDAHRDDVVLDRDLTAAGRVTGTVTGASGPVTVVAEDPSSHALVRAATASADGGFVLGGLTPGGSYDIEAVDAPDDGTAAMTGSTSIIAAGTADAGSIALSSPARSVTGTVSGAKRGTVSAGPIGGLATRSTTIGTDGRYTLTGLVPGLQPLVVAVPGRLDAAAVPVLLSADGTDPTTQDLAVGGAPATFKAWFISGGVGVPELSGSATSPAGDTVSIGPTTDGGHVTVTGLQPGTYTYVASTFLGTVLADDGPWWFGAPTGSFTLHSGQPATDVGPVELHAHQ